MSAGYLIISHVFHFSLVTHCLFTPRFTKSMFLFFFRYIFLKLNVWRYFSIFVHQFFIFVLQSAFFALFPLLFPIYNVVSNLLNLLHTLIHKAESSLWKMIVRSINHNKLLLNSCNHNRYSLLLAIFLHSSNHTQSKLIHNYI